MGFQTLREVRQAEYEAKYGTFAFNTKPYKSMVSWQFDVVASGTAGFGFAIARAQQVREWFAYGIAEQIQMTPGTTRAATPADTNLSKGRRTNGVEDMVIEGLSASIASQRIEYNVADIPAGVTDPDARNALLGLRPMTDPASIWTPPQYMSPFNLERAMHQAILTNIDLELEWDRKTKLPFGTLDQAPEGAGKSFLQANGSPNVDNRYRAPEGYAWRPQGVGDSELIVRGQLEIPITVPLNIITFPGGNAPVSPVRIYVDVLMRLHGGVFAPLSVNR